MTLYKTTITLYHRDMLTPIDTNVMTGKLGLYATLNEILLYWMDTSQAQVSEQELHEAVTAAEAV